MKDENKLNNPVVGLILAAGRGSRLSHLTDNKPKGMVNVGGRPIVDYAREALTLGGVQTIYTVTGFLSAAYTVYGNTIHNDAWSTSNMVYSLMCAKHLWRDHTVLVSYSDIIYDARIVQRLLRSPHDIAVAYSSAWRELWEERFAEPLSDAESFRMDADNRIRCIGQPCQSLDEIEGQYMGLLKMTPAGGRKLEELVSTLDEAQIKKLDMTSLLARLCETETAIYGVENPFPWFEIDSISDIPICEKKLEQDYV